MTPRQYEIFKNFINSELDNHYEFSKLVDLEMAAEIISATIRQYIVIDN